MQRRFGRHHKQRPGPKAPAPSPARPAPPKPEGPGWLAEQQANLLLYLGAFLIVIAALVFVSTSGEAISDAARMVLLVVGTLLLLAAGLFCLRFPRVQQAGVVFFAVGTLVVQPPVICRRPCNERRQNACSTAPYIRIFGPRSVSARP